MPDNTPTHNASNATDAHGALHHPRETILLLSFTDRDALASDLTQAGFRVVAARRTQGLAKRFVALDCDLVVLDARAAIDQAIVAAQMLASHVAARDARILLLYDRADAERLSAFTQSGISAMLPAPWHGQELALAIALARRQGRPAADPHQPVRQLWWHAALADGVIHIDSASDRSFADLIGLTRLQLRSFLRRSLPGDRHRAIAALRQLLRRGGYTAFSHRLSAGPDCVTIIHHLSLNGQHLIGHIEWQSAPNAVPNADGMPGARRLPSLAEALRALRLAAADKLHRPMVVGCALHGIADMRTQQGDDAANALVEHVAHSFVHALRGDFAQAVTLCSVDIDGFAMVYADPADPDRAEMEARLTATALELALVRPAHPDLTLLIGCDHRVAGRSADQIAASLRRHLHAAVKGVGSVELPSDLSFNDVDVRFQPQFSVADGRMVGAEALARWNHPRLGLLGGATLFAAAVASGRQAQLSHHIWASAMRAMAGWPAAMAHLRIALNATSTDIGVTGAAGQLLDMARGHGIAPTRLTIEVTEGAAIASPQAAAETLHMLRAAGVHVALDDFGTGYSGLAWLRQLPVDYIKVDAAFTRDAADSDRAASLLRGIVEHARTRSIDVLAEGVEDEQQLAVIADMGCRWFQGYLRAPALDIEEFVRLALGGRL